LVLTRCRLLNEEFSCDVTLTEYELLIHSTYKNELIKIKLRDVISISSYEDRAVINTTRGELVINVTGSVAPILREVGRLIELRDGFNEISEKINTTLIGLSKVLQLVLNVLKIIRRGGVINWQLIWDSVNELGIVVDELVRYDIDIRPNVGELRRCVEVKSLEGIRLSIKKLVINLASKSMDFLRGLMKFEDLRPLFNIVLLTYIIDFAYSTNQVLDAKRAEGELSNLCGTEVYVRMLNRPSVDLCRRLIDDLHERGAEEAIKEFSKAFTTALREGIASRFSSN